MLQLLQYLCLTLPGVLGKKWTLATNAREKQTWQVAGFAKVAAVVAGWGFVLVEESLRMTFQSEQGWALDALIWLN